MGRAAGFADRARQVIAPLRGTGAEATPFPYDGAKKGSVGHWSGERYRPRHRQASARVRLESRRHRSAGQRVAPGFSAGEPQRAGHRRRRARRRCRLGRGRRDRPPLRPARCGGLQCRHHDPQADPPSDACRMASRHRHQSNRGISARPRRRKTIAQSARRDRHDCLDARIDVGSRIPSPIPRPKAASLRSRTRSPSVSGRTCASIA